MDIKKCQKKSFTVIGREGSTADGKGFIQKLWADANSHFGEVRQLAKKDENGAFVGFWGAMSDVSRSFKPWEDDFSKGLYLAGVECEDGVQAPAGWTKWVIPSYEYIYVKSEDENTFGSVLSYMRDNGMELVGAANDFTCPKTGENYQYFPIRILG